MPTPTKLQNPTILGSGECPMVTPYTLAGLVIGTLRLATRATHHLRALKIIKKMFLRQDFYFLQTKAQKTNNYLAEVFYGDNSKNSSENLSNHNKHKPTFTNTFVFKTKHELKCQNELFF